MITGIGINKVEAERYTEEAITNMKFNINFDNVEVNQESISVVFTFLATYDSGEASKPKQVGQLKITGNITSKESKRDADEIASVWKSKKTLPLNFAENVINLLNFECGARGTLLASSIGLLAPLPISRAKLQETPPSGRSA